MLNVLIINWPVWDVPQKLMCLLSILIPLHIFEENTYPGGFFFGNNLGFGSKEPRVYPQNMLTNMITNLGAELVFIFLTFSTLKIEGMCVIIVIIFGVLETAGHTRGGIKAYRQFSKYGKKTIYDPGIVTSYVGLLELSVYGIYWFTKHPIHPADVLGGIGIVLSIVIILILVPFVFSFKAKSEFFAFEDIGYYAKYQEENK